jgi:DNA-binding beta-propeller fold protein YncE
MTYVRLSLALALALALALTACDDSSTGLEPLPDFEKLVVVLNSIDLSLTVFPVDSPSEARTIGLAATGSPVTLAARDSLAVVPMGFLATTAIADLVTGEVWTVPLPAGSGATGVAFANDSIVYVANPNLNTVSRINVFSKTHEREIAVSSFPHAVIAHAGRVFVLNAELDLSFRPARQGNISVIDIGSDSVVANILLTGFNPTAAAWRGEELYVVNAGTFGQGDGSLSVVNQNTLLETGHFPDFGEFPGGIAFDIHADAYISSFSYGLALWDASADSFIASPSNPIVVDGHTISSAVAVDSDGRLYTLIPGDCIAPSVVLRTDGASVEEIDVGVCPIDIEIVYREIG